jgi:hypothetical protein
VQTTTPETSERLDPSCSSTVRRLLGALTSAIQTKQSSPKPYLQQRLPALAEAGRLDGGDVDDAPQLVHDQARQRVTLHMHIHNLQHTTYNC